VLKAGHGITENKVELRIQFHRVPGAVRELRQCEANELVVRVQPEEAIYWKVMNKIPGLKSNEVEQMRMGTCRASGMHTRTQAHQRP
jgi:glucose-6-phosphate 1-dehydrogenase